MAKDRVDGAVGAGDPFRLLPNMLSSQPMCFYLFGEPARDFELATALMQAPYGKGVARVIEIQFEWAPVLAG